MKYGLDDKPGLIPLLLYGVQWWVATLPSLVIMGVVVARLHYPYLAQHVFYLQKLFVLMGAATIVQVLFGHRLPLILGPASTLLVGIIATLSSGVAAMYTAILTGGAVLAAASFCGLLSRLRGLFTPRIVAVILILIALSISPTILRLISGGENPAQHFCFALAVVFALVLMNARLRGIWKSLTILFGIAGGSLCYFLLFGPPSVPPQSAVETSLFLPGLEFNAGATLSFLFCFLALAVNELGSIEAVGHMLRADDMAGRIRRGAGIQGVTNMLAGAMGVIGPVDFSMSAGLIGATGCASRHTMVPAGILLALCGLSSTVVLALCLIPGPVMGALLLYLMAAQLAGGLGMLAREKGVTDFDSGIVVALPLMVGLAVAFAPPDVFAGLPDPLRPVIANGFVMGTIAVLALEHGIFRSGGTEETENRSG